MAKTWTCRKCGAISTGSTCDACMADRPRYGQVEKIEAGTWRAFCSWDNQGQHCRMKPTMMQHPAKQLCQWHYCVYYHATANTLEAFKGWVTYWWERRYCSLWCHYTIEYLWACVSGIEPPPQDPFACQQAGCDLRPDPPSAKVSPIRPATGVPGITYRTGATDGPAPLAALVVGQPEEEDDPNAGW